MMDSTLTTLAEQINEAMFKPGTCHSCLANVLADALGYLIENRPDLPQLRPMALGYLAKGPRMDS